MLDYPNKPIFIPVSFFDKSDLVVQALEELKQSGAWKGSIREREEKFKRLHERLCEIYGINVNLRFDIQKPYRFSGNSCYDVRSNTITLRGRFSVITYLHEFYHALQWHKEKQANEREAVLFSVSFFKHVFPDKFEKLMSKKHVLVKG